VVEAFDHSDGIVRIRLENGRSTVVPINRLSAEDRDHIYKSGWGQKFRNTDLPERAVAAGKAKLTRGLPPAASEDGLSLPNGAPWKKEDDRELVLPGMPTEQPPTARQQVARRVEVAQGVKPLRRVPYGSDIDVWSEMQRVDRRNGRRAEVLRQVKQEDLALDAGEAERRNAAKGGATPKSREANAAEVAAETVRAMKPTNDREPMTTPLPLTAEEQDLEKYRADANTEASAYREGRTVPQPGTAAWDAQARNMDRTKDRNADGSGGMSEADIAQADRQRKYNAEAYRQMGRGQMNPQQPLDLGTAEDQAKWDEYTASTPELRERYRPGEAAAAQSEAKYAAFREKYGPEAEAQLRADDARGVANFATGRDPDAQARVAQRKQWEKDLHSPDKQVRDAARSQLRTQDSSVASTRRVARDGTPVYDNDGQLVGVRGGTRNTPGWKAMEARDQVARDTWSQRSQEKAGNAGPMIDRTITDPTLRALNAQMRNAGNEDAMHQAAANIRSYQARLAAEAEAAATVEAAAAKGGNKGGNVQTTVDGWLAQNGGDDMSLEAQQAVLTGHIQTQHPDIDADQAAAIAQSQLANQVFRSADGGTLTTAGREWLRQTIFRVDLASGKVGQRMTAAEFANEAAKYGVPAGRAQHIWSVITGQQLPEAAPATAVAATTPAIPERGDL
jgi:hypothetical protein